MHVQTALSLVFSAAAVLLALAFWPNIGPAVMCLTVPVAIWGMDRLANK